MKIAGIIPARYASTRFPGKPLADIGGMTMIERVYRQALKSKSLSKVIIATDDQRIYDTAIGFGANVMMTKDSHQSGTDRCAEIESHLSEQGDFFDVIVNIQGDEPFLAPEQIDTLCSCFSDPEVKIATLIKRISNPEEVFSPNCVKVTTDISGNALYFSRNPIPFVRGADAELWIQKGKFFKHIGIYAYTTQTLRLISSLAPSELEKTESLEQLRWLENGYRINTKTTEVENIAIDSPEDLDKIKHLL